MEGRLGDSRRSLLGWIFYSAVLGRVAKGYREALALPDGIERDARVKNSHFIVRMMPFQSLRAMAMSSSGELPFHVAAGLADLAAFHPIRGLRRILSRER
jgi:beta-glucosidase